MNKYVTFQNLPEQDLDFHIFMRRIIIAMTCETSPNSRKRFISGHGDGNFEVDTLKSVFVSYTYNREMW